jgi:hypothetical protein
LVHCRRKAERRRSEDDEAASKGKVRRYFERDMAADAPADEICVRDAELVHDGADGAAVAGSV